MLEKQISKFADSCSLSPRMKARSYYIVKLLETVSSDLPAGKHHQLTTFMVDIISGTIDENILKETISETFKSWPLNYINKSMKFIGTYFHLLNQAELNEIIAINKERDRISDKNNPKVDSIQSAIKLLKKNNIDIGEAKKIIGSIKIHPTFTAHPTETRRPSIIKKQKKLLQIIDTILNDELSSMDLKKSKDEAVRLCKLIMLTDDVRSHSISAKDEINNTIKSTIDTLWYTISELSNDIESSFEEYYGEKVSLGDILRFHSWVGGDRDGNPNITSEITRYAIKKQISVLIDKYLVDLDNLFDDLSIHIDESIDSANLTQSIEEDLNIINIDKNIIQRYQYEPLRLKVLCIKQKLIDYNDSIFSKKILYNLEKFQNDLNIISEFLLKISDDDHLLKGILKDILVRSKTFGLNFVSLDIRQHSETHEYAIDEIIKHAKPDVKYSKLNETQKCDLLESLILSANNELIFDKNKLSHISNEVINTFKIIKEAYDIDKSLISTYVISMTHATSDVLEVLFLAKINGLVEYGTGGYKSFINVIPLYETIDDLKNAPNLLSDLIDNNLYKVHLENKSNFQEIMLGYSDSNKDGGFGMANYCLNKCQIEISNLMNSSGVEFMLFHGRGGSISRGGGKSNKAILSLPAECQNGKIRFTEQGEVINYRYGSARIAKRHLEQIISAQISALHQNLFEEDSDNGFIKDIIEQSYTTYRKDIINKDCWHFLLNATPINHISKIPITSRPASRKKIDEHIIGFDDLRAIPWVFSWTQIRYSLSGWYGMGIALDKAVKNKDKLKKLKLSFHKSKFFKQLLDNMSFEMARSRLNTSFLYVKSEKDIAFHSQIEKEYTLILNAYKKITGYSTLLERNKIIDNSIRFRNPFTDILSIAQVELLNRYKNSDKNDMQLDNAIFVSINHIAAAMQTTG